MITDGNDSGLGMDEAADMAAAAAAALPAGDDDAFDEGEAADPTQRDCEPCDMSLSHPDEVYGVAVCPPMVATGCKDDTGRLWDMHHPNPQPLYTVKFNDSVDRIAFSHSVAPCWYVAFGPLTGALAIRDANGDEVHGEFGQDITFLAWHPTKPILLYGSDGGAILQGIGPDIQSPPASCHGTGNPIIGCFSGSGDKAFVAFPGGLIACIHGESGAGLYRINIGHAVSCLIASSQQFAVGCENGQVQLRASADGKLAFQQTPWVLEGNGAAGNDDGEEEDGAESFVESVLFCTVSGGLSLLIAATGGGQLVAWDLCRGSQIRWQTQLEDGVTQLAAGPDAIWAGLKDGRLVQLILNTGAVSKQIQAHTYRHPIMDMALSKDHSVLVTVSTDNTAKVHKMPL